MLAELLGRRLIRLQCYEGIDASGAVRVELRPAAAGGTGPRRLRGRTPRRGPVRSRVPRGAALLAAIRAGSGAVLLVDELDRADDEFEAFLLEILSEFAVTIPEVGKVAGSPGRHGDVEPHARAA